MQPPPATTSPDHAPAHPPHPPRPPARRLCERASSKVEYVGLSAIAATLVTGIAAVVDSAAGNHLGTAIARRLFAVISGSE
jgi:hypothetical protein